MFKIQQEIRELRKKSYEAEIRIRQNEHVQNLEKSLKLLREESLKLTEQMNKKHKEIGSLKNRIKFLEEEKSFLTSYLKTMAARPMLKLRENQLAAVMNMGARPLSILQLKIEINATQAKLNSKR